MIFFHFTLPVALVTESSFRMAFDMRYSFIAFALFGLLLSPCRGGNWDDFKSKCDRGASYSLLKKDEQNDITISIGKSNCEEVFKIVTDSDFKVLYFFHLVRFYELSDDQNFIPGISRSVSIGKITVNRNNKSPHFENIAGGNDGNLDSSGITELLKRAETLIGLITSHNRSK